MSLPNVTTDDILNAMQQVPSERWEDALRAIEALQTTVGSKSAPHMPIRTGTDLRDSSLIGIWADRTDIVNSHEFARELRREAEHRE